MKLKKGLGLIGLTVGGLAILQMCSNAPPPDEDIPPVEPPPACEDNEHRNDSGECECDEGFPRNEGGTCAAVEPEPEPCDFQKLRDECEFGVLRLKCECKPDPDTAKPDDYVPFDKVEEHLFWQSHAWQGLYAYMQAMHFQGNRDIHNVIWLCPWAIPEGRRGLFHLTRSEAVAFANQGVELINEGERYMRNMWKENDPDNDRDRTGVPKPNWRCSGIPRGGGEAQSPRPEFCDVTNVLKANWRAYKPRLLDHMDASDDLRGIAGRCRTEEMSPYDSIAGWCTQMNKAGYTAYP